MRLIRIISDRMKPSFMKMSEHFNSWNAKEIAIKSPDRFVIVHSKNFKTHNEGMVATKTRAKARDYIGTADSEKCSRGL
ncbi:MAG: hypothetical protein DMG11_27390 [Acidobacteria bacterium]|nr:MAG: hypothetical protein DMG11_27390 [Acidobacteriota bacterium]